MSLWLWLSMVICNNDCQEAYKFNRNPYAFDKDCVLREVLRYLSFFNFHMLPQWFRVFLSNAKWLSLWTFHWHIFRYISFEPFSKYFFQKCMIGSTHIKFVFSKKATKIDEIFTVDLTVCSKCQIDSEDFENFCDLLKKHEL